MTDEDARQGVPGWVVVLALAIFVGLVGLVIVLSPRS